MCSQFRIFDMDHPKCTRFSLVRKCLIRGRADWDIISSEKSIHFLPAPSIHEDICCPFTVIFTACPGHSKIVLDR